MRTQPNPADEGLLAPDAATISCADSASADELAACERSVWNAQQALRKAKIRAELRKGVEDGAIQQAFNASSAELDALRESALRTVVPKTKD